MSGWLANSRGCAVRSAGALALISLAVLATACSSPTRRVPADAAGVELMLPTKLEIESFTKVVSFNEKRTADGIEVVIRALDAVGDPVKVVGTFNLELYRQRPGAASSQIGQRLSSWQVSTSDPEDFARYWQRFGRFYRFSLQLDSNDLPAGEYKLNAWIELPNQTRLFADREITHTGSPVPTATRL